ncbi:trimethylamine methyltransferase family protein [Desulfococcaceae bacterium HSG9]|nr:trimethylamine methyltransferase family protein [Desulfococcaceae bacterium HSG9]
MIGSKFNYLTDEQTGLMRDRVFDLLADYGVKLDPHPELFDLLSGVGAKADRDSGMVKFPRQVMKDLLALAPVSFNLGARNPEKSLTLPRPDGTFYGRSAGGCPGWIGPETGEHEKVTAKKLADWVHIINHLDQINLLSMLFCDDAPINTADVHALAVLLKHTDKSIWVQPYSTDSVEYLISLGKTAAGGGEELAANPVISMIVCSLTPRTFKTMDLEAIIQSAKAGVPIQACSLPGSGGTSPVTVPGTVLLATAEILAMTVIAQAVKPGAPVIGCPIIFSTDMRTGRSLQSSVESMRAACMAVQFIKKAFGLPTHNYGCGSDSPIVDQQSAAESAMLTSWMAASGQDILGGAGQLEVATTASPLQLIMDNEVLAMARRMVAPVRLDDDQMGWEAITKTSPGQHFMTSSHTFKHCREGFNPKNFTRMARDVWERDNSKMLMERIREDYKRMMILENTAAASPELAREIDAIVQAADKKLNT